MPPVGRLGTRRALDDNPLRRPIDRVQTRAGLTLLILLLIAGPVGAWCAGWFTYQAGTHLEHSQRLNHLRTTATVLAPPFDDVANALTAAPTTLASWKAPDGTARTGPLTVERNATAGTHRTIWTDLHGKLTTAPRDHEETVAQTVLATLTSIVLLVCGGFGVYALIRCRLDRRRLSSWEREWQQVGPQWSQLR
jgi:hypothetical protein